ncbi:amidohydrolase family protein [Amycolatopsis ultiminotia]|uniref:Amidohydrolase family protein n=1 Tax=Amycolatopsis ultiminotia TaxID=543629 RepID=A0ABP6XWG2_9PSEU
MTAVSEPPSIPGFRPDVRDPGWDVGDGGWDTHAHVFGPAADFPYAAGRTYTPPDSTPADYLRTLDALGLSHGVLVQPSCYGTDNSRLLAALAAHPARFRGVVDLDLLATAEEDLRGLAGVCGLRLRWPQTADRIGEILPRLRTLGWHADVLLDHSDSAPALIDAVAGSGVRVVVEAMGSPRAGDTVSGRGFSALREWLSAGEGWVKLSHPYAIDGLGPGPYPHAGRFAGALVETAPDRCVWGSDWPHPMKEGPVPEDGGLLGLLVQWAGGAAAARSILTTNPLSLY